MKIKRVIAVACAVAMLVSDVPSAVYAAEVTESTQMTESTQTAGNNLEDEPAESEGGKRHAPEKRAQKQKNLPVLNRCQRRRLSQKL